MFNPTRRNRNIGTAKQGYGQENKMVIPWPAIAMKSFYERLTEYRVEYRTINGNRFEFIIEKTRKNSEHACTVEDLSELIRHIRPEDYGRLNLIILRQPKRKEEILSSVWGRLIYSYQYKNDFRPAIILEAIDYSNKLKWPKNLSPEGQKELNRLKNDGHNLKEEKRFHVAEYKLDNVRNTQLYRTLPHEFGHYRHYLEIVGEIEDNEDEEYEEFEKRENLYFKIPTADKERYAHRFADNLELMLRKCGAIPFERIE
ncbi:MAG TPA: hypothetical protein ENJ95_18940 [Bacteroidetes bacterium]|nr:hypothetical protein [Bacteroidota bacterium]